MADDIDWQGTPALKMLDRLAMGDMVLDQLGFLDIRAPAQGAIVRSIKTAGYCLDGSYPC